MVKNERKLAKNQESIDCKSVGDDAYRDRGFTRPKVCSAAFIPCNFEIDLSCTIDLSSYFLIFCFSSDSAFVASSRHHAPGCKEVDKVDSNQK